MQKSRHSPPLYLRNAVPIVRITEVCAGRKLISMPLGRYSDITLPNGIPCRVTHAPDDSWYLSIGDTTHYQLIPKYLPIPRKDKRMVWSKTEQRYVLPFGVVPPVRFYIKDSLGKLVNMLFARGGDFGSRHELRVNYTTDRMRVDVREQRRLDKLFRKYPEKRADVMNLCNTEFELMRYKPWNLLRWKWMKLILAARYPTLKGLELDTRTSIILKAYDERPVGPP